jgi:hypothetical protein
VKQSITFALRGDGKRAISTLANNGRKTSFKDSEYTGFQYCKIEVCALPVTSSQQPTASASFTIAKTIAPNVAT